MIPLLLHLVASKGAGLVRVISEQNDSCQMT